MKKWLRKKRLDWRARGLRISMKALAPFTTVKSFQNVFFIALATGAVFALIRGLQTLAGSPLNGSRGYAALSLACPVVILALVVWMMRRQGIDGAALSARNASESARMSLAHTLAEREREELSLALASPLSAETTALDDGATGQRAGEPSEIEPPRRRSQRL